MPRKFGGMFEGSGKFPYKSAVATLSGTSWVTLVSAPPDAVSYHITRVFGQNTVAGDRVLSLAWNRDGTRTVVWKSESTAQNACFTQSSENNEVVDLNITLGDTDESLDIQLDNTGTDRIVASYEVREEN